MPKANISWFRFTGDGDSISGDFLMDENGALINGGTSTTKFYKVDGAYAGGLLPEIQGKTVAEAMAYDGAITILEFDDVETGGYEVKMYSAEEVLSMVIGRFIEP